MSETLTPVFRLEYFITAAANGTPCDLEPIFNEEKYLHAIAGASVDLPMPIGRTQEYLAKLAGMDVEIPDHPIFRTEYYLAHMIDSTVECPAPIFREEMFYYEWASNEYVTISGNPVSFTAKAAPLRQLSVAFSPVQNLNGYDNPWPAGGGKNKFDPSAMPSPTSSIQYHAFYVGDGTWTASTDAPYGDGNATVFFLAGDVSSGASTSTNGISPSTGRTQTAVNGYVTVAWRTYSNIDPSLYHIQIESGSMISAWTPYSNLCPISGWSSLTVEQRGKNLFAPVAYSGGTYNPTVGTTWTLTEITGERKPVLTEDGFTVKASANNQTWTFIQPVKYGVDYYLSVKVAGDVSVRHSIGYLDKNFKVLSRTNNTSSGAHTIEGQIDPLENAAYRYLLVTNATATTETITFTKPSLVIGDSAVEYTPYNGRSISISLGSTVYSGTVDVVTGVGEITWGACDMADTRVVSWLRQSDGIFRGSVARAYGSRKFNIISSMYKTYTGDHSTGTNIEALVAANGDGIYSNAGSATFFVADSRFTDETSFIAAVTGQTLCYERATPIPISLTPQEVQSLAGDNNLWSDANQPITVTYRKN